ncbi:hypothetical protein HUW52_14945 [Pseudomonas sp. 43A]|jgi:hypothetical protein|uniref:hypothetical protein n=1 Tax=unclassified Pseudomonas TaxID=196821 RepID=UPI0015879E35|nr:MULTISPECIES: hypothetical protein [unclassified Pseudomonas]QKV64129.1 hypothetical protein HUW52_14945 [Pseudomonas sp. 43A]QMW07728.1 hypothetical protein H3303_17755 [Pseudomonas sp. 29A]
MINRCSLWSMLTLIGLGLTLGAGCSSRKHYPPSGVGDACYAKALPSVGEGGLAWGSSLNMARQKSMNNCIRYAGRSGGTPDTCQVVLAKCR